MKEFNTNIINFTSLKLVCFFESKGAYFFEGTALFY